MSQMSRHAPVEANHACTGGEPAANRLLDSHVAANFSMEVLDFGAEKKSSDVGIAIKLAQAGKMARRLLWDWC